MLPSRLGLASIQRRQTPGELLAPGRPEGLVNILIRGPVLIAFASVPFLRIADSHTREVLGNVAENPTLDAGN